MNNMIIVFLFVLIRPPRCKGWVAGEGESSRPKKEIGQDRGGDREEGVIKNR